MKKSAALKRQMRYQQWVEEVKEFNSKPKDMTVREWCAIHDIKPPTFYDHMRRVQDYFAGQLQSIDESNQMVVSEPTFVELPPVITEPIPVTHGLASFVKLRFNLDPFDKDTLFLFCGRKATKIKGLVWEGDGFLLLYKRLEVGAFACPRTESETLSISELKEPKEIV